MPWSGLVRAVAGAVALAIVMLPGQAFARLDHLVCYKATLSRKTIAQTGCVPTDPDDTGTDIEPDQPKHTKVIGFFVNNQFGPEHLDSTKEVELCIPSLKFAP